MRARLLACLGLVVGMSAAIELGFRVWTPAPQLFRALPPRTANELRVFAYGESIVHGHPQPAVGVVEQLQYGLRATYPGRDVHVVNYGGQDNSSGVASAVAATMDQRPDAIIILTGGNEYLNRTVPKAPSLNRRIRAASAAVRTLTHWLPPRDPAEDPWPAQIVAYDRADLGDRVAVFRDNLGAMLRVAEAHRTPVLLCTVASNLRDWPPVHLRLAPPDAGDRAMRLYEEGRIQYRAGQYGPAHALLTRAKDLDPFPWRPISVFNDVIRNMAQGENVHLIDLERILAERSEGGIPGLDLMADNIHPNPYGSAVIAATLVESLRTIVPQGAVDRPCCGAEEFLRAKGFHGSPLEVEYLIENGKYTMKSPFYEFALSRDYFNKAIAIAPSNWQAWANLATLSLLEGDIQGGRGALQKATAFKGSEIDPRDRELTPYLEEALRQRN